MRLSLLLLLMLVGCALQTSGRSVDPPYAVTGPPSGALAPARSPPATGPSGSVSDFRLDP